MYHCTSSFATFFSPYVIKIIGFDSGLLAVNCIPFRMAQNVFLCHHLAKLPVTQSCDLLAGLSPGWRFNNFATQIKAELLAAIFFDIQRKMYLSVNSFDTHNLEQMGILHSQKRGIPHSLRFCVGKHLNGAVYPDFSSMNITLNWNTLPHRCCFWQKLRGLSCKAVSINVFRSWCCDLPACRNVYYCLPFEMTGFRHSWLRFI